MEKEAASALDDRLGERLRTQHATDIRVGWVGWVGWVGRVG